MRGDKKVIDQLNAALSSELTAIVQYMTQSEMCQNWGYYRIAGFHRSRALDEMKHAEKTIERIIFLDGTPEVAVPLKPQLGTNVQDQYEIDRKDEVDAVQQYNEAIRVCVAAKDDGTRELFKELIEDEEKHVDFLEQQLHSLQEMGTANYLSEQMKQEK